MGGVATLHQIMPAQVVPMARRGHGATRPDPSAGAYGPCTRGHSTATPRGRPSKRHRPIELACPGLRPPFGR